MKIALAQINPTVGDFQRNAEKICSSIDRAKSQEADLVVFPELAVTKSIIRPYATHRLTLSRRTNSRLISGILVHIIRLMVLLYGHLGI